jgi:hypothetical protein
VKLNPSLKYTLFLRMYFGLGGFLGVGFFPLVQDGGLWHNTLIMSRWIRFLLVMIVGIAGGLLYGWVLNPVKYVDTTPDTLRIDYKTDYVLMVAETYNADKDLDLAVRRLSLLGEPPAEITIQAILFAEQNGYTDNDLLLMRTLSGALQLLKPDSETSGS